jgi:aminoglycoside phosphotransferase (APT) family kinase protein
MARRRGSLERVDEQQLPGGFVTAVVRVGDTVRRTPPPGAPFVRALLDLFERRGWDGAPRFLGTDEQGREVLSYIDGHVAWQAGQPAEVSSSASLAQVARLVRQFHDLTAGTPLAAGQEVVCHNDLSPKNTVYRDTGAGLRPVAFLDWDLAAPGARIHDVAFVCWQYLDLGLSVTDPALASRGMRLICDAYGLPDRGDLIDTISWWQDRCWRGMEAQAAADDPAVVRLRDSGAVDSVRDAARWVAGNRAELAAGLG